MNEILCKWVSQDMTTMNDTKWEVGVPNELPVKNDLQLYRKGLFHYFTHPLIAVMFKIYCGCEDYTNLYEVVPEGKIIEGNGRCGSTRLTLVKKLEIPEITDVQKIAFAIFCSLEYCKEEIFVSWANNWLSRKDRSYDSAAAVAFCPAVRADRSVAPSFDFSPRNSIPFAVGLPPFFGLPVAVYAAAAAALYSCEDNDESVKAIRATIYPADALFKSKRNKSDIISLAKKAMEVQ